MASLRPDPQFGHPNQIFALRHRFWRLLREVLPKEKIHHFHYWMILVILLCVLTTAQVQATLGTTIPTGTILVKPDEPSGIGAGNAWNRSSNEGRITTMLTQMHTNTTSPWKYFPWKLPEVPETLTFDDLSHQERWCVMIISMGPKAAKFRVVERIWLSIRRRGEYFGPIIVLTDAPSDRYLGIQEADPQFATFLPPASDFVWDNQVDESMPYKRFKTYLTEYLDAVQSTTIRTNKIEYVLYLDADIVVGQSLRPWFRLCERYLPRTSEFDSMLFFQGNYDTMPVQGGQFAMHRQHSHRCTSSWRELVDAHPQWDKDQYSLKLLQERKDQYHCQLVVIPQQPWLTFVKRYNLDKIIASKNFSTLMHIQNTGHAKMMHQATVQKLFRLLLRLSPEEAQLNWKTPMEASMNWSKEQLAAK
eukprot:Nitzschia sp. Nitz4//scaffold22_size323478//240400//241653//NITZ4_000568-RA/size323478-processed-gene-0.479-mRNA-1//-1//CDS//3329543118//4259//frame0